MSFAASHESRGRYARLETQSDLEKAASQVRLSSLGSRTSDAETLLSSSSSSPQAASLHHGKLGSEQADWQEESQQSQEVFDARSSKSPHKWYLMLPYSLIVGILIFGSFKGWHRTTSSNAAGRSWENIDTLYIFGDSYTDTGNGVNMSEPSITNPFNDHVNQFPRPPNWVNFLTQFYLPTRFKGGVYNYAVGGATTDHELVPSFLVNTSFVKQTSSAIDAFGDSMAHTHNRAAAVVWFGVNDVYIYYNVHNFTGELVMHNSSARPPLAAVLESYERTVERLYDAGLRNFLFLTMPTVNRGTSVGKPKKLSKWDSRTEAEMVRDAYRHREDVVEDIENYNARLFELRRMLEVKHKDIEARVFDAHSWHARVLDAPQDFETMRGVTNVDVICEFAVPGRLPDFEWYDEKCKDGSFVREHAWVPLHMTFPLHNATGWKVSQDCFDDVASGFCL